MNSLSLRTWLILIIGIGAQSAVPASQDKNTLRSLLLEIEATLEQHIYDPKVLDSAATEIQSMHQQLLESSQTEQDFVSGFNSLWQQGPVSHVVLDTSPTPISELTAYFDHMNAGPQAVSLDIEQGIATLTINTMMGQDTIAFITQAYQTITAQNCEALIIDLRANPGGAFAIVPLVGHLITEPLDAGAFLSQKYFVDPKSHTFTESLQNLAPWQKWTLSDFWKTAKDKPITRVQFPVLEPHYSGPVYILTSSKTASAAELATAALQLAKRVQVVGETTAGQMLSQQPFALSNGWKLFVPFADYHAINKGRIEGKGILPEHKTPAQSAKQTALRLILQAQH